MKAIISVWMQPVYARINATVSKIIYLFLGLCMLTPAIVILCTGRQHESGWQVIMWALFAGLGIVLGLLLFFWFIMLVPSIALQYTPANASLVPGLKRRLQIALAIPVLLMSVIIAFFYNKTSHGHFFVSWLLIVALLLIYVATMRSQWIFTVAILICMLPVGLIGKLHLPGQALWNHPVVLLSVGAGLTALTLHWVFKLNGDRHFRQKETFIMMGKQMNGEEVPSKHYTLNFINPYVPMLRFYMAKVARDPAKARQLILFSVGAQVFWLTSFLSLVVTCVLGVAIFALFINDNSASNEANFAMIKFVGLASLLMLPPVYSSIVRSSVYQRKEEQGLLMLTPRLPSPHEQGKVFLQLILRQYLGLWVTTTLILGGASYFLHLPERMSDLIWLSSFCLFPVSILGLNNFARMKSNYQTALLAAFGLPLGFGLVSLAAYTHESRVPAWLICASVLLLTIIILYWRWHKLSRLQAVFPAGRAV